MLKHLPNALSLLRLVLAPVIAWAVWQAGALSAVFCMCPAAEAGAATGEGQAWAIGAALLFVLAGLTDLFDGIAARALNAHSKFGRMLDPIADKALVGLPLIALSLIAYEENWNIRAVVLASTVVIVVRDVVMTLVRLSAPDGEGVRVSQLAKWKTSLELVVVAVPIVLIAAPGIAEALGVDGEWPTWPVVPLVWSALLAVAAALSAYTGVRYLTSKRKPV